MGEFQHFERVDPIRKDLVDRHGQTPSTDREGIIRQLQSTAGNSAVTALVARWSVQRAGPSPTAGATPGPIPVPAPTSVPIPAAVRAAVNVAAADAELGRRLGGAASQAFGEHSGDVRNFGWAVENTYTGGASPSDPSTQGGVADLVCTGINGRAAHVIFGNPPTGVAKVGYIEHFIGFNHTAVMVELDDPQHTQWVLDWWKTQSLSAPAIGHPTDPDWTGATIVWDDAPSSYWSLPAPGSSTGTPPGRPKPIGEPTPASTPTVR